MTHERLSLKKAKKALDHIEGAHIDEEMLSKMTPEGRSLAVRVVQDMAIRGLITQISPGRPRTTRR